MQTQQNSQTPAGPDTLRDGGTSLLAQLPASENFAKQRKTVTKRLGIPRGNGEKVLVVDDEKVILDVTCRMLEVFGYRALQAMDGAEAAAIYAEQANTIDVVLTDLMMPVMDGRALARALRRISPAVKIIVSSGLDCEGGEVSEGIARFLAKPYTTGALLRALQEVLSETRED